MVFFIIFLLSAGFAFIPAKLAKSKGYSYAGFWLLSCFLSFVIAIIVAACLPKKQDIPSTINSEDAAAQTISGYCGKCGAQLIPGGVFCPVCGTRAAEQPKPDLVKPTQDINPGAIKGSFFTDYMGFILMGALMIITIAIAFSFNSIGSSPIYIALAMASAMTARSKGPDLSVGSIAGFAGAVIALNIQGGNEIGGLFLALFLCILIGFVNGVLSVVCKVPAVLSTLIMGTLLRGLLLTVTQGAELKCDDSICASLVRSQAGSIIFICLFVGIALLFAWMMVKKKPGTDRASKLYDIFAYVLSAIIGCAAGYYLLGRLGAFMPTMGSGYEVYILFIFFSVISSRLLDGISGMLYAVVPALLWTMLSSFYMIIGVKSFFQMFLQAAITLIFAVFAFAVQRKLGRDGFLLKNKLFL